MTRARSADDFSEINRRLREIEADLDKAIAAELCTCPPEPLVISGCPVHNTEFRQLLESSISACDCPADHDAQGVYRKVHVPGCLAHVWSQAEIVAYRHWVTRTAPEHGR